MEKIIPKTQTAKIAFSNDGKYFSVLFPFDISKNMKVYKPQQRTHLRMAVEIVVTQEHWVLTHHESGSLRPERRVL